MRCFQRDFAVKDTDHTTNHSLVVELSRKNFKRIEALLRGVEGKQMRFCQSDTQPEMIEFMKDKSLTDLPSVGDIEKINVKLVKSMPNGNRVIRINIHNNWHSADLMRAIHDNAAYNVVPMFVEVEGELHLQEFCLINRSIHMYRWFEESETVQRTCTEWYRDNYSSSEVWNGTK